MEDFNSKVCSSTSSELEMLASKVSKEILEQAAVGEKMNEVNKLQDHLKELKKRKNMLLSKRSTDVRVSSCCQQILKEAVMIECMKNSKYILSAQRHVGMSAEILYPGKIKFLFETSYKGKYFTTFFWELLIRNNSLETCSHNIPMFIPLTAYVTKYNQRLLKLSEMVRGVHHFLMAYVRRREQVVQFNDSFPNDIVDITFSKAYDLIQLILRKSVEKGDHVVIQLIYNNFCSSLPSSIRCGLPDQFMDKSEIKRAFRTLPIMDAYEAIFKNY